MAKWTFKQIEPQPARGTLREEMWDSPDWIAEEKYDGDRRIAQFCGKVVRFTGRRKSVDGSGFVEKTENVPHLSAKGPVAKVPGMAQMIRENMLKFPPAAMEGTVLDGEMIATQNGKTLGLLGGMSKYVTSIMGSLPEEAVRKQIERGWLRYVVFDCLFWRGEDIRNLPLSDRRGYAVEAVQEWRNPFVSISELSRKGFKRRHLEEVLARGGEGVVLKNLDHRYGDKQGWVKVKAEITEDVVVMGYKAAKEMSKKVTGEESITKYAKEGLIGAVVFGQYRYNGGADMSGKPQGSLVQCGTCSGMDDAVRRELTKHGKKYLGTVIEIKANGREPTSAFRHPRMIRFRPDKNPTDCVYQEGEI
jgi:ATP-dependent DNA ligase